MISGFLLVDKWEEPYALGVIPILKTNLSQKCLTDV